MNLLKMCIFLMICIISSTVYADFFPVSVKTGARFTCALSNKGTVKCWGYNSCNELGTGDSIFYGLTPSTMGEALPNLKLGANVLVKDICVGSQFACAATNEGKVKCWGNNMGGKYGSLGQGHAGSCQTKFGDDLPYTDLGKNFRAEHLSCGTYHACATNSQGQAKCWGMNVSGELGIGNLVSQGTTANQMGDNLPFLASSKPFQTISATGAHTCALIDNQIKCWGGGGDVGTLGNESNKYSVLVKDIDSLKPVAIAGPGEKIIIRKLTSHGDNNCVLYNVDQPDKPDRSHVKCWGLNDGGALGLGDTRPRGNTPGSMGVNLPEVDTGFDVIADIQSHGHFVCVLGTKGQVKCWGSNYAGQLGLGDTVNRGDASSQMGKNLPVINLGLPAKAISVGGFHHSCAILINNLIKCWGYNEFGQLGIENGLDYGTIPGDMGDNLPFIRLN